MKVNNKIKRNTKIKKDRSPDFSPRLKQISMIILPLAVTGILVFFLYAAFKSAFHIEEVIFNGNEHLSDEELRSLAGLKGKENLLMLSSSMIFDKMIQSPWIRAVTLRKELPSTLHFLIKEAEPFALLDMKGRLFIVDEKGSMLEDLKDSSIPFLPVISGIPFGKKEALSEALHLARVIKEKGLLSEKEHIEIIAHKPQEMTVNLDGLVVRIGEGGYEDKLQRLSDLEDEIKQRGIHVDYIDLRFANKAVVKPVNEVIH